MSIRVVSAATTSSLAVTAQAGGSGLSGMFVALEHSGSVIASGFTPVTFSLTVGQTYQVVADDYGQYSFAQWNGGRTADADYGNGLLELHQPGR